MKSTIILIISNLILASLIIILVFILITFLPIRTGVQLPPHYIDSYIEKYGQPQSISIHHSKHQHIKIWYWEDKTVEFRNEIGDSYFGWRVICEN